MSYFKRALIYFGLFFVNSTLGAPKRAFGVIVPALVASLGVNRAAVGALLSLGLWARLPGLALTSILSDYNPKVVLGAGVVLFSIASVGLSLSTSHYLNMGIFMFLLYMGAAMASYCSACIVVKEKNMGTTFDTVPMSMAKNVAVLVFGSIAIVLLTKYGVGSVFLGLGAMLVVGTLMFLLFTIGVELELKKTVRPKMGNAFKQKGVFRTMVFMIGYEGMALGIASMGMFIMKGVYSNMPMKEMIGLYMLIFAVPALLSRPLWGWFGRLFTPRSSLIVGMWLMMASLVFIKAGFVLVGIGLFSVGTGAGTVSYMPFLADRYGRERVGETFGVISIPYMGITAFFPMLSGYLYMTYGLSIMLLTLMAIALFGMIPFMSEENIVYADKRNG